MLKNLNNFNLNIQAHLIIGNNQDLVDYATRILQSVFCKKNSCNTCIICAQIRQHAHPNFIWLKPDKQYTLDQIEVIFKTIALNINYNEKFFIVIEHAEALTQACSNKLLKSIEEPPAGYYFIFLTSRKEAILPTIKSRCVITVLHSNEMIINDEADAIETLTKFFINIKHANPINFLKMIDKANINERECTDILDSLINYWATKCKKYLLEQNKEEYNHSYKIFKFLNDTLAYQPMPGASKIFLKNLFINMQNLN